VVSGGEPHDKTFVYPVKRRARVIALSSPATGGDHDDAIRAPRAIDGRRGGVLQDLHPLDVARRHAGEHVGAVLAELHPVDHDERRSQIAERRPSADRQA
jgi:aminoglycoside phosphotransferase (APT) family kinase protein